MSYSQAKSEEPTSSSLIPRAHLLKFLLPSLMGVLLFLVPFQVGDSINIGMGLMADGLQSLLGAALPAIAKSVAAAFCGQSHLLAATDETAISAVLAWEDEFLGIAGIPRAES